MSMKNKFLLTLIVLALAIPAKAQEHTAEGVAAGAVVGGVIGNQYHHNVVGGAVAGALIGGMIGNAADHANDQPKVVVVQAPPPPAPVVVQAPPPPPIPVTVQYVWGPLDRWGHPQYVYVQEWNGAQWVTTYYDYRVFLVWYQHRYGYAFREDMYRHHWHR